MLLICCALKKGVNLQQYIDNGCAVVVSPSPVEAKQQQLQEQTQTQQGSQEDAQGCHSGWSGELPLNLCSSTEERCTGDLMAVCRFSCGALSTYFNLNKGGGEAIASHHLNDLCNSCYVHASCQPTHERGRKCIYYSSMFIASV